MRAAHELVFLFSDQESHFLKRHTRPFIEPYGQSDLSSSICLSNDKCVGAIEMHMKYILHNKFRMIIFHDQKALSLNFKSSNLQMLLKIYVLKNLAMFTGKHLCWSYFLI